jgi:hypothetical protein
MKMLARGVHTSYGARLPALPAPTDGVHAASRVRRAGQVVLL